MTDKLDQTHAKTPAVAHPSSSIMLLRESSSGYEVLMEKRCDNLKFAPGAYVFPGGRVDPADESLAQKLAIDLTDAPYRFAAIRELAEETGVNLPLDMAKDIAYFAHWVTPPQSPKRFETKFYLAHTDEDHTLVVDKTESQEAAWINPHEMLAKEEEGAVSMMFPTRLNLMKLAQSPNITHALTTAKKSDVITVMPEHEMRGGEMWFTIPVSAGYPISEVKREDIFELMGVKNK